MNHTRRMLQSALLGVALGLFASVCDAELIVIVSAKSAVSSLTENEVADIYLGRTSQLPGGGEVVPIDLSNDSASRGDFYRQVVGKSSAQLRAYWSKLIFTGRGQPPREVADASAVKKLVANGTNTIGYIEKSDLDSSVKAVLTLH